MQPMFSKLSATRMVAWVVTCLILVRCIPALGDTAPGNRAASEMPSNQATLRILADVRSPHTITPYITGKFAEHLGSNIYNGMCAQILRNATMAEFPFWTGSMTPDGRTSFHSDGEKIAAEIRRQAGRQRWPQADVARLVEDRSDGLAFWWIREGARGAVRVSPDTGPYGGRAQRVETQATGQGIAQWTDLPLHRVRQYEYEVLVRSPDTTTLSISLTANGASSPASQATINRISRQWSTIRGMLQLGPGAPADVVYKLALTTPGAGQIVVARILLWPADHMGGADPDVVRLLKESHLPILRWPGGNFVSAYHWEDGVGPAEQRPTRPNWAWGGVEPNLFGTDEFIAFCRAVGCEPMICVNTGDGTPEEAARWIEYCNGPVTSPMGARRAANGHPEPYGIRHWEVGNEVWGRWQNGWTTPRGNADRYGEFARVMRKADPEITLWACGAPVLWGKEWNEALFAGAAAIMQGTTDHPLIGGNVSPATDPLDVYRDFMAVPNILERKWTELRGSMHAAGISQPRLAITELQMFAHIGAMKEGEGPARLRPGNLVNPATQAEALYNVLMYHTAIRLAPYVGLVTHSATVNHGGGLRKERERVYANPCHHAQAAFSAFAGATPVSIQLTSPVENAPFVLPDIRGAGPSLSYSRIAALAALAKDGSLLVSLIDRGTSSPVRLNIEIDGFKAAHRAEVWSLSADVPWAANTLNKPDAIAPMKSATNVTDGRISVEMRPFTIMQLRFEPASSQNASSQALRHGHQSER